MSNEDIRRALVDTIISAASETTKTLDSEDLEVLARYGRQEISRAEMEAFFENKAARIEAQMIHPQ